MDNLDKVIKDNFATGMKHEGCGGDMIPLATLEIGGGAAAVPMRFVVCMTCKSDALELSLQDPVSVQRTLVAFESKGFWVALEAVAEFLQSTVSDKASIVSGYLDTVENIIDNEKTLLEKSQRKEQNSRPLFNIDPIFWNSPRK
jgi:hypothetical protein